VLPDNHHEHDRQFIKDTLSLLPLDKRLVAVSGYSRLYDKTINDQSLPPHRRENAARYECNTRLRAYVKACTALTS